jgi:hypothetical protein
MRLIINSGKQAISIDGKLQIYLPSDIEVEEFHIISTQIPMSFYNINSTVGNTILVNSTQYTITPKNYTIISLRNALNDLLTSLGISIVYDIGSFKYTFSRSSSFNINFRKVGKICGFLNDTLYTSTLNVSTHQLSSPNVCDFTNGLRNIYLKSNIGQNEVYENSTQAGQTLYTILLENFVFGEIVNFKNLYNKNLNNEINKRALKYLEFWITDDYANLINFNGLSYVLEFYIKTKDDIKFLKDVSDMNEEKIHPFDLLDI